MPTPAPLPYAIRSRVKQDGSFVSKETPDLTRAEAIEAAKGLIAADENGTLEIITLAFGIQAPAPQPLQPKQ